MNVINVLISDGRKVVREGLSALLQRHQDIRVVGEADGTRGAIKLVGPLDVHVVVLIVPHSSNGGALSEVRLAAPLILELIDARPGVSAVALTVGLTSAELKCLIHAGVKGCLTRECASDELVTAIRSVAAGKLYLDAHLTEQVAHGYVGSVPTAPAEVVLPARETEVLRRIAAGQSTKEIAFALGVGTKTVETHRRRVMEKLDLHSVAELTHYAIIKGLISLPQHAQV